MSGAPSIEVSPVRGRRDREAFLRLPWRLYRGNPAWVPPLLAERRRFLDPRRNPFFRHSQAELFLVRRAGAVVGRIAAAHNRRHLETWGDGAGFFGFFECEDDAEAAGALLAAAGDWLRARGLASMRGPTSFTINDESGLLLDAFDRPPVLLMPYNPPHYRALLEGAGCRKAQDLLAYRLDVPARLPARLARAEALAAAQPGLVIRPVDLARFREEVGRIHRVHSAAWAENWGAVPLSAAEIEELARELLPIVVPELALLAERDGEPVGVSITLPDFHEVLARLDGRLLPFGWARALWWRRRITGVRVLILGVVRGERRRGIEAALVARTVRAAIARGYRSGELSWILESNAPMRRLLERLGAQLDKTYRLYERAL